MDLRLDFRSNIPIYTQIVEQIRQQVVSGGLKPGEQLPTVRALASDLRVNFNTIARAYRILDEAGIISTQQGRGTYILEMPPPETNEALRQQALKELTRRYLADAQQWNAGAEELMHLIEKEKQEANNNAILMKEGDTK